MNHIATQLKNARTRQDIEVDQLAVLSGLSADTIHAIESGTIDVQVSTLRKLSEVLRCSFSVGDMSI
ncbi:helix-turn-helix domain-containing protein [Sutcliffiella rhizosphaerae]|uniref:HTH cro/C1-type domain-containing protein n=1 Tax=Sutcliffiella rhizosphaerae TaxID=2880967 RepID=A0ABM8YJN0_9BACI|nr:helix-turn-helix transcriptional regulator [Sutcliffiella rhizosphaerae]CAG9620003.1 hypothetical protein BACCIP111883_00771 [Sutcliffiella rhizosphaerae]